MGVIVQDIRLYVQIAVAWALSQLGFVGLIQPRRRGRLSAFFKGSLNKAFDKLRPNGNQLIPFVLSLSKHEWNQLVQRFLKKPNQILLREGEPPLAATKIIPSINID